MANRDMESNLLFFSDLSQSSYSFPRQPSAFSGPPLYVEPLVVPRMFGCLFQFRLTKMNGKFYMERFEGEALGPLPTTYTVCILYSVAHVVSGAISIYMYMCIST